MRLLAAVPVVLAALVVCAPASAAVARVDITLDGKYQQSFASIVFEAAPGERNAMTVQPVAIGTWVLHDDGAGVTAGSGCTAVDARTARCTVAPPAQQADVKVRAGDLDDSVRALLPGPYVNIVYLDIDGGAGDDILRSNGTLRGGAGNDELDGGPSNDTLIGGPGRDILRGAAGDDMLTGDGPGETIGDDVLDGGPGRDIVSYETRTRAVRVDLAQVGAHGAPGERDSLGAIEGVTGGAGDDVLRGDGENNILQGGRGNDEIDGRGGDDRITGGDGANVLDDRGDANVLDGGAGADALDSASGHDRVRGGPGADRISSLTGGARLDAGTGADVISFADPPAVLACGPGRDVILGLDHPRSSLSATTFEGCEGTLGSAPVLAIAIAPQRTRAAYGFAVFCRRPGASCRVRITLRLLRPGRPGLALGRAMATIGAGEQRSVHVALGANARRALRGRHRPLVEVNMHASAFSQAWRVRPGDG